MFDHILIPPVDESQANAETIPPVDESKNLLAQPPFSHHQIIHRESDESIIIIRKLHTFYQFPFGPPFGSPIISFPIYCLSINNQQ